MCRNFFRKNIARNFIYNFDLKILIIFLLRFLQNFHITLEILSKSKTIFHSIKIPTFCLALHHERTPNTKRSNRQKNFHFKLDRCSRNSIKKLLQFSRIIIKVLFTIACKCHKKMFHSLAVFFFFRYDFHASIFFRFS